MDNQKIAQELMMVAKQLQGAEEIEYSDLPKDRQTLINKVFGKSKVQGVWSGIHGYIVDVKGDGGIGVRLDKSELKVLTSNSEFRWIEGTNRGMSIGL
jgi:hypothetical protein